MRGRLDLRCSYGAPWRIVQDRDERNPVPCGARWLRDALDDSGGADCCCLRPVNLSVSGNRAVHSQRTTAAGSVSAGPQPRLAQLHDQRKPRLDERFDLLCGHFAIASARPLAAQPSAAPGRACRRSGRAEDTAAQLGGLVAPMRSESADDHLGGRAMLNALSTAMFTQKVLASETEDAPRGLPALAGNPRLAPAVAALFNDPARAWSLLACAPVQHVASDACPSIPGEARTVGKRSPDEYPHDARGE